ncbi:MAG: putative rane protein [Herbinix sp.]|jgi:stage III sporulation protein AF|nr:putative rane protein [Herbinix sp.]
MDIIYNWIRNVVIYMILNAIIMNLLGDKSYKKYVSIVSGMILVLIIISPLMNYMDLEDTLDYYLQANDFAVETSEFKNDLNRMEEAQSDVIFAEYEEKVRLQVQGMLQEEKLTLVAFDLTIDKNSKNPTFGEILHMDISAELEQSEEEEEDHHLSVDEIEITSIRINEKEENDTAQPPSPMEINIKNKLADFYNIEQVNINISISH